MKDSYKDNYFWVYRNAETNEIFRTVMAMRNENYKSALLIKPIFELDANCKLTVRLEQIKHFPLTN